MQREMDKIFGQRGPAHLVALIPDSAVAEPGRVTWTAIPSWDPAHIVAEGINAQGAPTAERSLQSAKITWTVQLLTGRMR
jgi:hypothetical protein